MEDGPDEVPQGPCHPLPTQTYKGAETLLHNLPYITMTVLGAIVLFQSFRKPTWAAIAAGGYVLYGLLGALWIMIFVCPFCRFWDTDACPCMKGKTAT